MDTSIHREEVFSENKHEIFAHRLGNDMTKLIDLGIDKKQLLKIVGTFPYVIVYTNTPIWLYPILKLPKGLKWSDGKKFIQSVSKEVYGYVIYYSSLSRTDIYQYELIPNKKY